MLIFIKDLNCTLRLFMSMTQFYLASCRDRGGKDCWLRVFLLELQTVRALSVIVKTDGSFAALIQCSLTLTMCHRDLNMTKRKSV